MKIVPIRYQWREIWVGMQLICGNAGQCVLIDSGIEDAVSQALLPALQQQSLPITALSMVINTHSHDDHNGCNPELRQCTTATFAGASSHCGYDTILADGATLEVGGVRLEVVHTPGHSDDSICVIEPSTGTLFSGDSIQGNGITQLGLPLWNNASRYLDSLEKLRKLHRDGKFTTVFLGHQFQPSNGVLTNQEIPEFLQASENAVRRYIKFAQEHRHLAPQEFYTQILDAFQLHPHKVWEATAFNMAKMLQANSAQAK